MFLAVGLREIEFPYSWKISGEQTLVHGCPLAGVLRNTVTRVFQPVNGYTPSLFAPLFGAHPFFTRIRDTPGVAAALHSEEQSLHI